MSQMSDESAACRRVKYSAGRLNEMNRTSRRKNSSAAESSPDSIIDSIVTGRLLRHYMSRHASLFLCVIIVLFPLSCIYIGYAVGLRLAPSSLSRRFPDADVVVDTSRLNYSHYRTHNITLEFVGGLGNQMFQYASLYGVGRANGLLPVVDSKSIISRMFHTTLRARQVGGDQLLDKRKYSLFVERRSNAFDQRTLSLNFMRNIRLDGYFQSWRYFDHVQKDLREQFAFRASIYHEAEEFLMRAGREHLERSAQGGVADLSTVRYVGVHVRRGDMLDPVSEERGYTTADVEYLNKALRYFERRHDQLVFIVCSDDLEWVRENIETSSGSLIYSKFSSQPFHDLCLLSLCNDTVITVGTFGWWGAWLAGGETVYYRQYPRLGSPLRDNFKMSDYYPSNWIPM